MTYIYQYINMCMFVYLIHYINLYICIHIFIYECIYICILRPNNVLVLLRSPYMLQYICTCVCINMSAYVLQYACISVYVNMPKCIKKLLSDNDLWKYHEWRYYLRVHIHPVIVWPTKLTFPFQKKYISIEIFAQTVNNTIFALKSNNVFFCPQVNVSF